MSGTWRCTTAPPTACSASVTRTGGLSRGSWINGKSQTPNPKPQTPNPNARHGDVWIWVLGFGFWNLAKALVYIELHGASAFSFLRGASLPETLVERAAALGYPALALLDADGVYGAPRFHKAAKQAGLRAIIGAELTIGRDPGSGTQDAASGARPGGVARRRAPGPVSRAPVWQLPILVASAEGYRNLCRLVTRMKMRAGKGEGALALEELDGFTTGLVALAGRPALDTRHYGV